MELSSRIERKTFNETNDCCVIMMVELTGLSYAECHGIARKSGRDDRQPWDIAILVDEAREVGYQFSLVDLPSKISVGRFLRENKTGKFIVTTHDHVVAVKNGRISDLTSPRSFVEQVWVYLGKKHGN